MLRDLQYDQMVAGRIGDFLTDNTPWFRDLWQIGPVLALEEFLEAARIASDTGRGRDHLGHMAHSLLTWCKQDAGVTLDSDVRTLARYLKKGTAPLSLGYESIKAVKEDLGHRYLERWATALRGPANDRTGIEGAARSIAAHMLDRGFSSTYLHRWFTYRFRHDATEYSLADIVEEAASLAARPKRSYEVVIPLVSVPDTPRGDFWLDTAALAELPLPAEVTRRMTEGALRIPVEARDPWAAVDLALEDIERLQARLSLGTQGTLVTAKDGYVVGQDGEFSLRRPRRMHVYTLEQQERVFDAGKPGEAVDAALGLLAPLTDQTAAVAVSGSWAAIEALLLGSGDDVERGEAASRLSTLITASWPRAEFTRIARAARAAGGELGALLNGMERSADRAAEIERRVRQGDMPPLAEPAELAALRRMQRLVDTPTQTFRRVHEYVVDAIRRLYRQRNLVMHAGRTERESVALRAALRTAAPLVGAAFDRIAHAWFVYEMSPLELVARAEIEMSRVSTSESKLFTELIDIRAWQR